MKKLLIQQYLETHNFFQLATEHGIYASFSKNGKKFSLNYSMIEAKDDDPLAQECRGLILSRIDESEIVGEIISDRSNRINTINRDNVIPGETKLLAYPMKRFFNNGQGACAPVNWDDPQLNIMEKLDGTLAIVGHDPFNNSWFMATRSAPDADIIMDNGIFTFRTLFEKALKETNGLSFEEFTQGLDKNYTYCFELCCPLNRIVCYYPDYRITLLAVRNLTTLKEEDPTNFMHQMRGVPLVQSYPYTSIEDLLQWVSNLDPIKNEGVVVRDSNYNRIKIKNILYVSMSKIRDRMGSSERNILEILLKEKDDDVRQFLPQEIIDNMDKIKIGLQNTIKRYDTIFLDTISKVSPFGGNSQKEFALLITADKTLYHAPFFQMFAGKCSNMRSFISRNQKSGTWNDSFLDKILELSKKHINY